MTTSTTPPGPKIPALWFDARGCGPSDLALQVSHQDHGHPNIAPTLGLRIRVNGDSATSDRPMSERPIVYAAANEVVDSGFMLHRDQVVDLYLQLAAWLGKDDLLNHHMRRAAFYKACALSGERPSAETIERMDKEP